jgi:transposase
MAQERDEAARSAWRTVMREIDPRRLVFLDETSTPTTLTRLQARALPGQRAVGRIPRGRREAISWLATLTPTGIGESLVVRGAVDRLVFEAFVERVLAPSLRPGQIVVLDNLSVHKSARARTLIAAAGGHLVFFPTYSPDFHPIAPDFAKTKQALRRSGARSCATIVAAVGAALTTITPADAHAFFTNAGFPIAVQ